MQPAPKATEAEPGRLPPAQATPATEAEVPVFEWKFGIRWRGRQCYLNIRLGAEQRSPERLQSEGLVRLPLNLMAYLAAGTMLFGVFGVVCFVYLLMAGIDVLPGASQFFE